MIGVGMMLGTRTRSFWRRDRLETRRRLKSLVVKVPSCKGVENCGHRRLQVSRKERISRPECFDRVSHTAPQKRVQISFVSLGI